MRRTWRTKLTGKGTTPSEALASLLEDEYANQIKGTVYIYPERDQSLGVEGAPIVAWRAESDVALYGEFHPGNV